jgi:pyridinium-3,5-biscarboxylic acid mononucleotide sulfurtransferase
MSEEIQSKVLKIKHSLQEMKSVIVAYSGGIDSTLMLQIAHETLGEQAIGITAVSASMPEKEREEAENIARKIGANYDTITSHETEDPRYLRNSPDRCFFCKSDVYSRLAAYAKDHGYQYIVDGTNADDVGDHRPGRQAASEQGVRSPMLEAGLTKNEIRSLAREYGLPNWDKPAAACLASRVPYGTLITIPMLSQIEKAEFALRGMGFHQLRVRHHDQIARIEIEESEFTQVMEKKAEIVTALKEIGYAYVTLDLAGFRSGSMNEVLKGNGRRQTT